MTNQEQSIRKAVSELEFGQEMQMWTLKGTYPLEMVSLVVVVTDNNEKYYYPTINQYIGEEELVIKHKTGFISRAQALECVGRCWDKALTEE